MKIIKGLEKTRDQTLRYFGLRDDQLVRSYGPDKWPIRFILHHLADAETVFYERIRRVISTQRPVLWAFDQDAWARELDYSRMPLGLARRAYDAVRAGIIYRARLHYEKDGHLAWVHSKNGIRTLKDEFDKVVAHNEKHLAQIKKALKGS